MTDKQNEFMWTAAEPPHSVAYIMPVMLPWLDGMPQATVVLDAGCGNGAVLGQLNGRGWKLHGLDASQSGIEEATRAHPGLCFEQADLTSELSAHPLWGQCDMVVSLEVVEHVFQPRSFAQNCYGFLKPGGCLILSTPYHGYLKNLALATTGKMDAHFTALWDFGHIKFWSCRTLSTLLTEQGFHDIQFRGAGRIPYFWKSIVILAKRPEE